LEARRRHRPDERGKLDIARDEKENEIDVETVTDHVDAFDISHNITTGRKSASETHTSRVASDGATGTVIWKTTASAGRARGGSARQPRPFRPDRVH
jgi:hypothetical protein